MAGESAAQGTLEVLSPDREGISGAVNYFWINGLIVLLASDSRKSRFKKLQISSALAKRQLSIDRPGQVLSIRNPSGTT